MEESADTQGTLFKDRKRFTEEEAIRLVTHVWNTLEHGFGVPHSMFHTTPTLGYTQNVRNEIIMMSWVSGTAIIFDGKTKIPSNDVTHVIHIMTSHEFR